MASTYHIVQLPRVQAHLDLTKDSQSRYLAEKHRALRLHALQTAPEAFASTYELESPRGLEHTLQRMSNPKASHFVALRIPPGFEVGSVPILEDCKLIVEAEWVGMMVLVGPQEDGGAAVTAKEDAFARMTASSATNAAPVGLSTAPNILHYHLNGTFVSPSARGSGLGKRLIEATLVEARKAAKTAKAGLVATILVNDDNVAARKVYESAGFVVIGSETYTQQPRGLLGETAPSEKVALAMELREPRA